MLDIQQAYDLGTRFMRVIPTVKYVRYLSLGDHGLAMHYRPKVIFRQYAYMEEDYVPDLREGYVIGSMLADYRASAKGNPKMYLAPAGQDQWGLYSGSECLFKGSSEAEALVLAFEDLYPEKVK